MHKLGNDKKVDKGNVTLMNHEELLLNLKDNEWPLTTINHDRQITRAIVVDDEEIFYFVRANREIPVLKRAKDLLEDFNNLFFL